MSRKLFALAVAAAVLVPVLIVGLNAQVKDAPTAEKPKAADPFLAPTAAKEKPKPARAAAGEENPFAGPVAHGEKPKAKKPAPASKPEKRPATADRRPLRSGEKAIRKVLGEPTRLELKEVPLNKLVEQIQQKHRIPVFIDKKALDDVNSAIDTPVTGAFSDVPLRSALRLILNSLDLTWLIKGDVLLITTPEVADQCLTTKTYDVTDLVLPLSGFRYRPGLPIGGKVEPSDGFGYSGMGGFIGGMWPSPCGQLMNWSEGTPPRDYELQSVMDTITRVIRPSTWASAGGPGSIHHFHGAIVVSQTQEVHEELEALLTDLRARRQGTPTILVELKWLWLDARQHEQLVGGGKRAAAGRRSLAVDAKALEILAATVPGFRGQIACDNGQWVHLASGDRRSAITSSVPVIGSGVGYQPVIQVPNVGIVVEVRPSVAPGAAAATLDVQSTVTRWAKPQPPLLHVGGSWPPFTVTEGGMGVDPPGLPTPVQTSGGRETTQAPGGSASAPVERPQMPAQQLATTLRVPLGKPVIVGAISFAPEGDAGLEKAGDSPRQLYLIATASVATDP